MVIIKLKTESQTVNKIKHLTAKLQHSNQHSTISWVSSVGTEQPGQGATLLGWPKSIYYCLSFSF